MMAHIHEEAAVAAATAAADDDDDLLARPPQAHGARLRFRLTASTARENLG
jgi:hypothetical protein